MKITKTTTHEVSFSVEYFHHAEGGMDTDEFGKPCKELAEAITLLQLAQAHDPQSDWVIVAQVKTVTTS